MRLNRVLILQLYEYRLARVSPPERRQWLNHKINIYKKSFKNFSTSKILRNNAKIKYTH